jgi:beta-glucosidase/6-phospho-beta-glucosidase/beta-galactosidase
MPDFMFATGIENSYPLIPLPDGTKKRVDQMESCGHYVHWREDFELTRELGIKYLRYGPPYYRTHVGADRFDWSFSDETFQALRNLNITPIVDLCHFGVPDWIGSFQNPDWPRLFAIYARAFAERYPWVTLYTPVNEIYIAATFSAEFGWWNECARGDRSFVNALKHLAQASVLAMHEIVRIVPHATFVHSESSEFYHPFCPSCLQHANFMNQKRFLSRDLVLGHEVSASMYEYLIDHGMTRDEYHWFFQNKVRARNVMGNDYYVTNEHIAHRNGEIRPAGELFGYYVITHQYFSRYRLPVMHTETNLMNAADAPAWLQKEWANVYRLKQDGVPILGFTWYSLTDQMDWDSALREDRGNINPVGLFDLNRRIRPVGEAYRELIAEWRNHVRVEDGGLWLDYGGSNPCCE